MSLNVKCEGHKEKNGLFRRDADKCCEWCSWEIYLWRKPPLSDINTKPFHKPGAGKNEKRRTLKSNTIFFQPPNLIPSTRYCLNIIVCALLILTLNHSSKMNVFNEINFFFAWKGFSKSMLFVGTVSGFKITDFTF